MIYIFSARCCWNLYGVTTVYSSSETVSENPTARQPSSLKQKHTTLKWKQSLMLVRFPNDRSLKDCFLLFVEVPGGFEKLWGAGRIHFHHSWYLSDFMVPSYGQTIYCFLPRVRYLAVSYLPPALSDQADPQEAEEARNEAQGSGNRA